MLRTRSSLFTSSLIVFQLLLGLPEGVLGDPPYPAAQPCFDAATATAKCDSSSTAKFNACACSNSGDWLSNSAKCIGQTDRSELTAIYNSLATNCAGSNTPIVYSLDKWLAAAGSSSTTVRSSVAVITANAPGATKTSTLVQTSAVTVVQSGRQSTTVASVVTVTPDTTLSTVTLIQSGSTSIMTLGVAQSTSSPSVKASGLLEKSGSKLNTPSIVGIAIGVVCFFALIGILVFLFMRKKKRENRYSQSSDTAYDPHHSGQYEGNPIESKMEQPAITPYPDNYTRWYEQPTGVQQQPSSMRPDSYIQDPGYSIPAPRTNAMELQGQPTSYAHELPAYR